MAALSIADELSEAKRKLEITRGRRRQVLDAEKSSRADAEERVAALVKLIDEMSRGSKR